MLKAEVFRTSSFSLRTLAHPTTLALLSPSPLWD
jgi:hypothetical protein